MKTKFITTLLMCCLMLSAGAQKLAPTLIAVAGMEHKTPGGKSLSYSIGELITSTTINTPFALTMGFQQPQWLMSAEIYDIDPYNGYSVFPNPTSGLLHVQFNKLIDFADYKVYIYDLMGRLQEVPLDFEGNAGGTKILLNLTNISPGQYFIRIITDDKDYNSIEFKIIKID
ncbi:T9SS type A sorting domain-containing protein [candidate division KSB1 bacterium]